MVPMAPALAAPLGRNRMTVTPLRLVVLNLTVLGMFYSLRPYLPGATAPGTESEVGPALRGGALPSDLFARLDQPPRVAARWQRAVEAAPDPVAVPSLTPALAPAWAQTSMYSFFPASPTTSFGIMPRAVKASILRFRSTLYPRSASLSASIWKWNLFPLGG